MDAGLYRQVKDNTKKYVLIEIYNTNAIANENYAWNLCSIINDYVK